MAADHKSPQSGMCERRADARLIVNAPVEIAGTSNNECPFTERTVIENVSDVGCRFSMRGAVQKGDTIAVRLLAQDGQSLLDEPAKLFEVMWVEFRTSSLFVGARILSGEKLDKAKLLQNPGGPKLAAK